MNTVILLELPIKDYIEKRKKSANSHDNDIDKECIQIENNEKNLQAYKLRQDGEWCWWCCHSFTSVPVHIPIGYDQNEETFKVYGNFCSFSCAKTFNNVEPIYKKNDTNALLSLLYYKCTGKRKIHSAPLRYFLKQFGGPYTIEEFRNDSNKIYEIIKYPMVPVKTYLQTSQNMKINEELQTSHKLFSNTSVKRDSKKVFNFKVIKKRSD